MRKLSCLILPLMLMGLIFASQPKAQAKKVANVSIASPVEYTTASPPKRIYWQSQAAAARPSGRQLKLYGNDTVTFNSTVDYVFKNTLVSGSPTILTGSKSDDSSGFFDVDPVNLDNSSTQTNGLKYGTSSICSVTVTDHTNTNASDSQNFFYRSILGPNEPHNFGLTWPTTGIPNWNFSPIGTVDGPYRSVYVQLCHGQDTISEATTTSDANGHWSVTLNGGSLANVAATIFFTDETGDGAYGDTYFWEVNFGPTGCKATPTPAQRLLDVFQVSLR